MATDDTQTGGKQAGGTADKGGANPDLAVEIAGLRLANPLMTASGTSGYGPEYAPFLDINALGAFVTKSVTVEERPGNPQPRTVETRGGMINAIGLANVGLDRFCAEKIPFLADLKIPVVVNVAGHSLDDYVTVCRRMETLESVSAVELNVSCPNVSDGLEWGTDPGRLEKLTGAVRAVLDRCRLIVKLTPNVTDVAAMAQAAIDGGAQALSLINTLRAMAINVETRRPMLANVSGGLSGPAVKPVALFLVRQVYTRVAKTAGVPLIAMGGIQTWRDAVEFHLAGATACAVGTALFVDPRTPMAIKAGVADYLRRHGETRLTDIIGAVDDTRPAPPKV